MLNLLIRECISELAKAIVSIAIEWIRKKENRARVARFFFHLHQRVMKTPSPITTWRKGLLLFTSSFDQR